MCPKDHILQILCGKYIWKCVVHYGIYNCKQRPFFFCSVLLQSGFFTTKIGMGNLWSSRDVPMYLWHIQMRFGQQGVSIWLASIWWELTNMWWPLARDNRSDHPAAFGGRNGMVEQQHSADLPAAESVLLLLGRRGEAEERSVTSPAKPIRHSCLSICTLLPSLLCQVSATPPPSPDRLEGHSFPTPKMRLALLLFRLKRSENPICCSLLWLMRSTKWPYPWLQHWGCLQVCLITARNCWDDYLWQLAQL